MDIGELGPQDFVYGSMILHHLEPFEEFARTLRAAIRPGGKGYFYENNAASRTMVWFRRHVVGKMWVPKHGDDDEFPLEPHEVDELAEALHGGAELPRAPLLRAGVVLPAQGEALGSHQEDRRDAPPLRADPSLQLPPGAPAVLAPPYANRRMWTLRTRPIATR